LMSEVPWYSVDSSTWAMVGAYGRVFLYNGGSPIKVIISDRSPYRDTLDQHYDNLTPDKQEKIRAEVEARGWKLEDLRNDYRWCAAFTSETFEIIRDKVTRNPPKLQDTQETLFVL